MTHGRVVLLLAASLALPLACSAGSPPSATHARPEPSGRRIVLVGLDAADWLTIDPLARAGKLPTFARLRTAGATGVMLATPPLVSPILWTTIATGMQPEDHAILDFMVDLADGTQAPVGSSNRRVAALWNLFSDVGRQVAVVGWWATWPAESVRGTIVSDQFAPQLVRPDARLTGGLVSPAGAAALATRLRVAPATLSFDDLTAYVPLTRAEHERIRATSSQSTSAFYQDKIAHLASVVAATRTYASVAVTLARADRPDFLAVYLESLDTISHLFVRDTARGARAIERAYRDADDLVRQLAEASPPDTLIVVCSDHGFYPPTAAVKEDPSNLTGPATAWHRPYGIVAVAEAGTLAGRHPPSAPSAVRRDIGVIAPIDVAPTVLHAAGLAVPSEMPGTVISAVLPAEAASRAVRRAPSSPFVPGAAMKATDQAQADRWARLQALGYVGAVKSSLARQNLGESLFRRGKVAAAERELRAVVEAQPANLAAQLWLAKALVRQGRSDEALKVYERAVRLPEGARESLVEAVDLAASMGQSERGLGLVRTASIGPDSGVAIPIAQGILAEARQLTSEAERHYRAALKSDPLSFEAAVRLLDLLRTAGRAREAVAVLTRATELAPDSPRHQALLGSARLSSQDAAGAEAALTRALTLAPDGDAVRIDLARAQLLQRKSDAVLATLLAAAPSRERSQLLGAAYSSLGRWDDAVRQLQSAAQSGGETPELLNSLGWAELKRGRPRDAASCFSRSLAMKRDQPEIKKLLSEAQAAMGSSR